jgi:hypothetical protein
VNTLKIIGLALQFINIAVNWARERQLISAGEAIAINEALELTNARVKEALAARLRARNSDPDPSDPYRRD